jgi:hypothetical protein
MVSEVADPKTSIKMANKHGATSLKENFATIIWIPLHSISMFSKRNFPTVSFSTCVWEKDWRAVLLDPDYLKVKQIENHAFPFSEKLLIINNVSDLAAVEAAAAKKVEEGVLTRTIVAERIAGEVLDFFQLKRSDFRMGKDAGLYKDVNLDWIYYNALGPLCSLYVAKSDYLLFLTGDVRLDGKVDWVGKAIRRMEKRPECKVANLVWNNRFWEAARESYKVGWNFFTAKTGFSDQMFLVKTADFRAPIYGEIREDSSHFPRGDVWEKRAFSAMKNRSWERLIYWRGSYTHENFP